MQHRKFHFSRVLAGQGKHNHDLVFARKTSIRRRVNAMKPNKFDKSSSTHKHPSPNAIKATLLLLSWWAGVTQPKGEAAAGKGGETEDKTKS
jgi:hypothetical protein